MFEIGNIRFQSLQNALNSNLNLEHKGDRYRLQNLTNFRFVDDMILLDPFAF